MNVVKAPAISIIIPVYNVEDYLRECLDSVVGQSFGNIEIICINDCSTDGSLAILREYEARDMRVIIIDKPLNEGLSITRNVGIEMAIGSYILFVDSDDFIDRKLCEKAYYHAEENKADLVVYDFIAFHDAEKIDYNQKNKSMLSELDPEKKKLVLDTRAFAWLKLIRMDLVRELGLKFPPGLLYEDLPVHWEVIVMSNSISILPERLYYYRQRDSSITYRTDWKLTDRVLILDLVREFLDGNNLYQTYQDLFLKAQLEVFSWLYEYIDPEHKKKTIGLIETRLDQEHWDYIECGKTLSWKAKVFYKAKQGSLIAKVQRRAWFVARNYYRKLKRA